MACLAVLTPEEERDISGSGLIRERSIPAKTVENGSHVCATIE